MRTSIMRCGRWRRSGFGQEKQFRWRPPNRGRKAEDMVKELAPAPPSMSDVSTEVVGDETFQRSSRRRPSFPIDDQGDFAEQGKLGRSSYPSATATNRDGVDAGTLV
jgi:hypothetical protein